ncbi:hypothetical protein [Staphylococcus phage vB_StaM_SA1]|nr:hypothetical protein [Staphylococcus phage vB_StaM_SA1]
MLNFREDNNFIIINEKAFVPGKGKGPFVKPFQASGSQIRLFRRLGLHVTIVDEDYEYPSSKKEEEETKVEDQEVSEAVEDKADEKIEEKVEEPESQEEEEAETEEESKEEAKEVEVTEEDLNEFTVAELKEELDSKEIEYANNARKKDLIELLLQNQ